MAVTYKCIKKERGAYLQSYIWVRRALRSGYRGKKGREIATDNLGWISDSAEVPRNSFIRERNISSAKSYVCFVGLPY